MSKILRQKPSATDLIAWSDEHLMYELGMLKYYVQLARTGKYQRKFAPSGLETEYYTLEMALLEALLLHARSLYEFFFEPIPTNEKFHKDARAADFFDNASEWYLIVDRDQLRTTLDAMNVKERIGYEAAHLTYKRHEAHKKIRWEWTDMYNELSKTIKAFIASANHKLLAKAVINFPVDL